MQTITEVWQIRTARLAALTGLITLFVAWGRPSLLALLGAETSAHHSADVHSLSARLDSIQRSTDATYRITVCTYLQLKLDATPQDCEAILPKGAP